ncbi:serine/threonine protein kinase [Kribbella sp. VKM Ac-2527]|uniref:Serine/threonine protein kinase n=1 Tax=Kribbella caucasensis TaxID=2512215 RepID=A0A4R6JII0_9ACTN|nr:serine/threonine-protein kinase [Kribbella sp. VKM Ac-2527]TDO35849.1 serine/threonine protein kinase [Kribbella sp. VKM Ac-2527]
MQDDDPVKIGPFVVQGRLGRGAMGAVYLAKSPGGRLVAVKVVRGALGGDDRFRARFAREIEAARKVSGAFTAAVVDADPLGERPWLATEYLPGPTLQQAVEAHGPLAAGGLRYVAAGLAEALLAIHRCGVVHRDLKPSNIVLTDNGPRVIDFGIARALEDVSLTATGLVIGTPGYLSPEQITGAAVGPASDMFSFGAVVVYAATGHGPFGSGPVAALAHRVVHEEPRIPVLVDGLDTIVHRCLTRNPEARPTPQDVLQQLEPVSTTTMPAAGTLIAPPPPAAPPPLPPTLLDRPPVEPVPIHHPPVSQPVIVEPPPVGGTTFVTTRARPAVIAAIATVVALSAGEASSAQATANEPIAAWFSLIVCPAAWWIAITRGRLALRRRVRLQLTAEGLTITRGSRTGNVPWAAIARLRIAGDLRRPWLVIWFHAPPGDLPVSRRRHHGAHRIYPVGHELSSSRRARLYAELRAALTWYAARLHDLSP